MFDIKKQPYTQWLEESLRVIVEFGPVCLCIAAASKLALEMTEE